MAEERDGNTAETLSIEEQIRKVQSKVKEKPGLGDELREQAIAAVYGGARVEGVGDLHEEF